MKDRHEGKLIKGGCSTVRVSTESMEGTLQSLLLRGIISNIRALFGSKIGPGRQFGIDTIESARTRAL
jgi:hypothetical protein